MCPLILLKNAVSEFEAKMNQFWPTWSPSEKARAHEVHAQLLADAGEFEKSLKTLENAVQFDPESPTGYYWKAETFRRIGNFLAAIAAADDAIQRDPDFIQPFQTKMQCLRELRRFQDAVSVAVDFLERTPLAHVVWFELGVTFRALGRTEDAMYWLERVVARCPHPESIAHLTQLAKSLDTSSTGDKITN